MLWVPKGLVEGIVGFALEVRAELTAKYNFLTCDPLFVEVRCLIFFRRSFFFPTLGEDVDVSSVVCCHFRQVCVGAEEQGHSVGNVSVVTHLRHVVVGIMGDCLVCIEYCVGAQGIS